MILRDFRQEDAAIICKWIRTGEELYKWSADRYNKFPIFADDIIDNYAPQVKTGRFIPLTAEDADRSMTGHLVIRYPKEDDNTLVRFGFVVIDPELRGKGYGKELLRLAAAYALDHLHVRMIDLGVFESNSSAVKCYEAVGFKEYGRQTYELPIGVWECINMHFITG